MQCDICCRPCGSKLPFLCPTDARNFLYGPRIEHVMMLLEKDALDQKVTTTLSMKQEPRESVPAKLPIDIISIKAEKEQVLDRTRLIITKADDLREKVEQARQELLKRKDAISRRKSDFTSASDGIDTRRSRLIEDLQNSVKIIQAKWHQNHITMMSARAYLCGEAARLYGLKRIKTRDEDIFKIGGSTVINLRILNTVTAAQITTALSHIVHLLMLSAHYLGIRLPAEITLPHRDYPLPTVFPLQSSYKYTNVPFPSNSLHSNQGNSRSTAKSHLPHPRPLFIQKPLPVIAIENPLEYSFFIEGVTLLAYNVAWVCKSQGLKVGEEDSFGDICNIGRNMFNLLIGVRPRPSLSEIRVSTNQSSSNRTSQDRCYGSECEEQVSFCPLYLGKYSHSAAHSFLTSVEGTKLIRSWNLPNPTELADRLRSHLVSEIANAEWEVLNADSWQTKRDGEVSDKNEVLKQRSKIEKPIEPGMQSFISIKSILNNIEDANKAGSSGWTKLKPR